MKAVWSLCVALLWLFPAVAQQPPPHLGYVYPAGGGQGTSFQATVGGQFLAGATNAHFPLIVIRITFEL